VDLSPGLLNISITSGKIYTGMLGLEHKKKKFTIHNLSKNEVVLNCVEKIFLDLLKENNFLTSKKLSFPYS
jgi:hypothetical protein